MTIALTKPVRRTAMILGRPYVLELDAGNITFREKGRRHRLVAPLKSVLQLAERLAGEEAHREKLRDATMRRLARGRVIR